MRYKKVRITLRPRVIWVRNGKASKLCPRFWLMVHMPLQCTPVGSAYKTFVHTQTLQFYGSTDIPFTGTCKQP